MAPYGPALPPGALPPQTALTESRARFTEAYALIPREVLRDIVTSRLPGWRDTRVWVLARPLGGFAETFAQMLVEVAPGGGAARPEPEAGAEAVLFMLDGVAALGLAGTTHEMTAGGYAYLAPGADWRLDNPGPAPLRLMWIRRRYLPAGDLPAPASFVTREEDGQRDEMPGTQGRWSTLRFVDPEDMAHDMHVNIVRLDPGAAIPFPETHVMEHGLFVLEGKGVYRLNTDWVEVTAGDFMWLRAFCPQACYAGGPGPFRYLLYKDVNRHMPLGPAGWG